MVTAWRRVPPRLRPAWPPGRPCHLTRPCQSDCPGAACPTRASLRTRGAGQKQPAPGIGNPVMRTQQGGWDEGLPLAPRMRRPLRCLTAEHGWNNRSEWTFPPRSLGSDPLLHPRAMPRNPNVRGPSKSVGEKHHGVGRSGLRKSDRSAPTEIHSHHGLGAEGDPKSRPGDRATSVAQHGKDQPDRTRIDVSQDHECRYWSQRFNVSPDELRRAAHKVGPMVEDVARELGKRHKA